MSRQSKRVRVPRALMKDLCDRWASIIEEDDNTEGFWDDVAKFYDVENRSSWIVTPEQMAVARECIRLMAKFLRSR